MFEVCSSLNKYMYYAWSVFVCLIHRVEEPFVFDTNIRMWTFSDTFELANRNYLPDVVILEVNCMLRTQPRLVTVSSVYDRRSSLPAVRRMFSPTICIAVTCSAVGVTSSLSKALGKAAPPRSSASSGRASAPLSPPSALSPVAACSSGNVSSYNILLIVIETLNFKHGHTVSIFEFDII